MDAFAACAPSSLRAKRSNPDRPRIDSLDCFVADAPRNDEHVPSRGMNVPELCIVLVPRTVRGRREDRMLVAPAASCAKVESTRVRNHRLNRSDPAFPARMVLRLIRALLGVPGLLATVARNHLASLIPASGDQDHALSPSASFIARQARSKRPSHPVSTFVTTHTPLGSRRDVRSEPYISEKRKRNIFDGGP